MDVGGAVSPVFTGFQAQKKTSADVFRCISGGPGTFELASNVPVFIGCYVPLLLKAYTGAYMLLASAVVVPV